MIIDLKKYEFLIDVTTKVKHFDRRREYLKFKNMIDSGDKNVIDDFLKNKYHK